MYNILTLDNISVCGLERFPREQYQVSSEFSHPDAIILRSYKLHDMAFPDSLKAVARAGAGTNNIPIDKLSQLGIPVFNTPGANANAVKELVVAGMLLAARNICFAWDYAKNLEANDQQLGKLVESGKKQYAGFELPGKTLGIIGLGAIGVQVANVAVNLGLNVIAYEPQIDAQRAWQLSPQVKPATSLDELLNQADFISFHVPLTHSTRAMIDKNRIQIMKDKVTLLNFSRGEIIDEEAVLDAINADKIHAYICDFPTNKIKQHKKVITLPHLGASTKEAEDNCATMAADELRQYLEHGNIVNSVNFPEVSWPESTGCCRLAIVNTNVPEMVAKISNELGKAGININDMMNKSQANIAYTLIDTSDKVSTAMIDKLKAIEGILSVRQIQ